MNEASHVPMARLAWLPRSLRPPVPIPLAHMRIMWLVGIAAMIAAYDLTMFGMALKQIQADLRIPEDEIALTNAIFRLGIVPAVFVSMLADRFGRRRLLMVTILGSAIFTMLTGFSQSHAQLTGFQLFVRMFAYAEDMLCIVVIAEEFDEKARGWAIGMIGALGGLGGGVAAIAYGLLGPLEDGWRYLYILGAVPLFVLAFLRRRLVETRRFENYATSRMHQTHTMRDWLEPAMFLLRQYPGRLALLAAALFPLGFAIAAPFLMISKHMQEAHGITPGGVTIVIIAGGGIAIIGNFVAGLLSDRVGRRGVFVIACLGLVAGLMTFYNAPTPTLAIAGFIIGIFFYFAADVILAAFGAELFPTSYRSTASAVRLLLWIIAGAIGLALQGQIFNALGSHAAANTALLAVGPLSILFVPFLPEPSRKTLEEIAPERIIDAA
ncbi:MAG: MFS transporter [Alphaproteobacteria bacterium]|nr:MFS transporter [Alphaproteobacteria bacterium]